MDTNLLHHVGLGSSAGGLPSLSILNQLTQPYAAAAAAAAALAARGPNIITTCAPPSFSRNCPSTPAQSLL